VVRCEMSNSFSNTVENPQQILENWIGIKYN